MSDPRDSWIIDPEGIGLIEDLGIRTLEDGWNPGLPGEIINDRGDRQVLELVAPGTGQVVYLKRWRFPASSLFRLLPGHRTLRYRAHSEWDNLRVLRECGIRVPAPYLLAERMSLPGPEASLLLIEGLTGYTHAAEWLDRHPADRGPLCQSIACLFRRLHDHHLFYRSPGLKHFYVAGEGLAAPLALIDVPRLDRPGRASRFFERMLSSIDIPGPLRDLSKVLLTLRYEIRANEKETEEFWKGYFQAEDLTPDMMKLKAAVDLNAQLRLRSRTARLARKTRSQAVAAG